MFDYNIKPIADNDAFLECCKTIEDKLSGLKKDKLLVDVDGTAIQAYEIKGKAIKVFNDYEVDAVYITSEYNLDDLFKEAA